MLAHRAISLLRSNRVVPRANGINFDASRHRLYENAACSAAEPSAYRVIGIDPPKRKGAPVARRAWFAVALCDGDRT